jgi:hypothetical protein
MTRRCRRYWHSFLIPTRNVGGPAVSTGHCQMTLNCCALTRQGYILRLEIWLEKTVCVNWSFYVCSRIPQSHRCTTRLPKKEHRNRFSNFLRESARTSPGGNASFRDTRVIPEVRIKPMQRAIIGPAHQSIMRSFAPSLPARSRTSTSIKIQGVFGRGKLSTAGHSIPHLRQISVNRQSTLQPPSTFSIKHGRMRRKNLNPSHRWITTASKLASAKKHR